MGTLVAGFLVDLLETRLDWTRASAYRAIFILYSVIGLLKAGLALMLSAACEAEQIREETNTAYHELRTPATTNDEDDEDDEHTTTTNTGVPAKAPSLLSRIRSMTPHISQESRSVIWKLCLLFAVDSFASGLVPLSWLSYYFNDKFGLAADTLGTIFFVANLAASASGLVASSLAKRIGLIRTMVFTHTPSAIFLSLIPVPSNVGLATTFLFLRSSTSSMDQAPRQAFLAAAVLANERTAVMGVVNVVKTLAQSAAPTVTGAWASQGRFWIVFLVAGALKVAYDMSMLVMFLGFKGRGDEA